MITKYLTLALVLVCGTFVSTTMFAEEAVTQKTAAEMQADVEKAIAARAEIDILDTRMGQAETGRRTGLTFGAARSEDARRTAAVAGDVDGFVASVVAWPFNAVSTTAYSLADETRPAADRSYFQERKKAVEAIEVKHGLKETK